MTAQYVVGIDLGTTNSVLAYTPLAVEKPRVELLGVPQLVSPGTVESRSHLPSFMYLASEHESAGGALELPWAGERRFAVGEYARAKAAEAPERTIGAAKSWLCHHRVDRHQPILPWNAPKSVGKVSPVTAAQHYLEHLAAAWDSQFPDAPSSQQQVVLTVPASFDAVARELTREAALSAGLSAELVLLEEPQAAVYAWLATVGDRWRKHLKLGDRLLVCDVGGGTTDLTLVGVAEEQGELVLRRLAVGDHLLVGGDNMDLALGPLRGRPVRRAGRAARSLAVGGPVAFVPQREGESARCRDGSPERQTISVLGRGSKVIGGTVSIEVERSQAAELLVEGFFPRCGLQDRPRRRRGSGFQEIGLPFESDTAITRHVAAFLGAHAATDDGAGLPSHVLFNGGVFKAERAAEPDAGSPGRVAERPTSRRARGLAGLRSRGGARRRLYGWTKRHGGMRIRGGVARSYYIGIETSGLGHPGGPAAVAGPVRRALRHGRRNGSRRAVRGGGFGAGRAGSISFLQLRRAQAGPARRRADLVDQRRSGRNAIRSRQRCRSTRQPKTPTCPCVSSRGSRNWACSSCGASAPRPAGDGSWSSACARIRRSDAVARAAARVGPAGRRAAQPLRRGHRPWDDELGGHLH